MNYAQQVALKKIVENIADELDELSLVVDSFFNTNNENAQQLEKYYLDINDALYWLNAWFSEQPTQEIQNANNIH